jgi:hypothetical protein
MLLWLFLPFCANRPLSTSSQQTFVADTSICGINLCDGQSVESVVGNLMHFVSDTLSIPHVVLKNKYYPESLKLFFYPGSSKNEFCQFEVTTVPQYSSCFYDTIINCNSFTTETGISLFCSRKDLILLKGSSYQQKRIGDFDVIEYAITDSKSPFLRRYAMPAYRAAYYFKKGKLVKYIIGFDYP